MSPSSTTKRETPYSRQMQQKPNGHNVVALNPEDLRVLSGKDVGKSVLIFKHDGDGTAHFYGLYDSPAEIMDMHPGKWMKDSTELSAKYGKNPDERFVLQHESGQFMIIRYV